MNSTVWDLDRYKRASLLLIPFSLILIILFTLLDIRTGTEPPFLLTILNTLFIGIIPLVIMVIAFRSYQSSGSTSLFMMGSGMMIFGLGSIAAGWLIGLPGGPNISVAVYNVCIFVSAAFYLTGALLTFTGSKIPLTAGPVWKITAITAAIVIFVSGFIVLIIAGSIPPFFIVGVGPTVLRQVILSNAIALLIIGSLVLFHLFTRKREDFFFWYSVSLAVIAIGLVAALIAPTLGSPVNWISRGMQYVGAGFSLIALIVAGRIGRNRGLSLEETLGVFFSNVEAGYRALVEAATDAIVVFDQDYRIILLNNSALRMFGYTDDDSGLSFTDLIDKKGEAGVHTGKNGELVFDGGETPGKSISTILCQRKDGSTFLAELTLSRHTVAGSTLSTCIIRDTTERRKAEEHLKFQANLLANISDVVYSTDLQMRLTSWNPAAGKMYGWKEADVLGKPVFEFIGSKFDPEVRDRLTQELLEKGSVTAQIEHTTKAGNPVIFDSVTMLLRDADERIKGFVSVNHDITDRKRAEEELRQEYDHTAILLNSISDSFTAIDRDWRITFINRIGLSYTHKLPGEIIGRTIWDVYPEITGTPLEMFYREAMATQEPRTYVNMSLVAPGRFFELHTYPMGKNGISVFGQDVTERKRAEDALRESEERLRLAQEAGNIGIWDWNPLTGEVRWTPQLEAIYRLEPGSVRTYADFLTRVHPEDLEIIENLQFAAVQQHKPFENEFRFLRPDGETGWVYCRGGAVYNEDGKAIRVFGVNIDITERKNSEEALKRKNEDLGAAYEEISAKEEELHQTIEELSQREEDLNQALTEKEVLLSEIHHRVKNNLTAFISLLSLEGSYEDSAAGKALRKDLQNRARSMALIHETLYNTHKFSEVDMEEYLSTLTGQVVSSYGSSPFVRIIVEAKGITLDIGRATPAGLIINELITNSLKYAFPQESVTCQREQDDPCTIGVRMTKDNGMYVLEVFDNGIGLPAGFDPLTTKTLGLKLVTFLARHQLMATIEVGTKKGTDVIFRFEEWPHGMPDVK